MHADKCVLMKMDNKRAFNYDSESKIFSKERKHWLLINKKVLGEAVSKEGHADSLLRYERTDHYWFPWKRGKCKLFFIDISFGTIPFIYQTIFPFVFLILSKIFFKNKTSFFS